MSNGKNIDQPFFYGEKWIDDLMFHEPLNHPRFAHLARKVLSHYIGNLYNPHEDFACELAIRLSILAVIEYKIFHQLKEYDREYIDNIFKERIENHFKIGLKHDTDRIKKGFAPLYTDPFQDPDKTKAN